MRVCKVIYLKTQTNKDYFIVAKINQRFKSLQKLQVRNNFYTFLKVFQSPVLPGSVITNLVKRLRALWLSNVKLILIFSSPFIASDSNIPNLLQQSFYCRARSRESSLRAFQASLPGGHLGSHLQSSSSVPSRPKLG